MDELLTLSKPHQAFTWRCCFRRFNFSSLTTESLLTLSRQMTLKARVRFQTKGAPIACDYTNKIQLQIPSWLHKTRGHDLIEPFRNGLSLSQLNNDELHKHAEYQSGMVAMDLLELLKKI